MFLYRKCYFDQSCGACYRSFTEDRIFYPKSVIVYSNIFYTFAFVNDIKKWNKAVRSFVVKTVSNV